MEQIINDLIKAVYELKNRIEKNSSYPETKRNWIPKKEVMSYLGFAETQMAEITRKYNIVASKIGKETYYSTASISAILEKNKKV